MWVALKFWVFYIGRFEKAVGLFPWTMCREVLARVLPAAGNLHSIYMHRATEYKQLTEFFGKQGNCSWSNCCGQLSPLSWWLSFPFSRRQSIFKGKTFLLWWTNGLDQPKYKCPNTEVLDHGDVWVQGKPFGIFWYNGIWSLEGH